jgi:predicted amidohydrolase YtcJ
VSCQSAFVNGRIHTLDARNTVVDAVLVDNGKIASVGSVASVLQAASLSCVVYDMAGALVVPGFIDPHNHLSQTLLEPISIGCSTSPEASMDDVLELIHRGCRDLSPGQWARGVGFNAMGVSGGKTPTREQLDDAAPNNPLLVIDESCHRGFANSLALAEAGIGDHSPQPWGGVIDFDHQGRPTGTLLEAALDPVQTASWNGLVARDETAAVDLMRLKMLEYASLGITSVCDAAVTPESAELFARADRTGALPLTIQQLHTSDDFFGRQDLRRQDFVARVRDRESERLRGGTMKIFVDHGFPDGPPMDRIHDGCHSHTGTSFYGRQEVRDLALAASALGIRTAIHAMGNWSVDAVLDAYEAVRRTGNDDLLRVEHAFVAEASVHAPRMAELGVDLVTKPGIIHHTGPLFDQVWRGVDQPHLAVMPIRSMIDAGVRVSFASDAPAGPVAPAQILWGAVARSSALGGTIQPEEAISATEALRCATINAAFAAGRQSEEGSIEAGKRANLAVLDRDILTCPTDDIRDMVVLATIVDGRTVHEVPGTLRPAGVSTPRR